MKRRRAEREEELVADQLKEENWNRRVARQSLRRQIEGGREERFWGVEKVEELPR
jgi:hypothetical protein